MADLQILEPFSKLFDYIEQLLFYYNQNNVNNSFEFDEDEKIEDECQREETIFQQKDEILKNLNQIFLQRKK